MSSGILVPHTPFWEVVVRTTAVYGALLVMVRIAGKREIGQLGPLDLLAMLILSETVSPALTGQDTSLGASLVSAATLLVLSAVVGRVTYHSRTMERLIEGTPEVLVVQGRIDPEVARRERISDQDLEAALRREGLRSLRDVEQAVVEPNGAISIIPARH